MGLINKSALVAEIDGLQETTMDENRNFLSSYHEGIFDGLSMIVHFLDTIEMEDENLIIHTIIAECCDWLTMHTNLSHDKIEDCRNLMLTVKEEQFKAQKGE